MSFVGFQSRVVGRLSYFLKTSMALIGQHMNRGDNCQGLAGLQRAQYVLQFYAFELPKGNRACLLQHNPFHIPGDSCGGAAIFGKMAI